MGSTVADPLSLRFCALRVNRWNVLRLKQFARAFSLTENSMLDVECWTFVFPVICHPSSVVRHGFDLADFSVFFVFFAFFAVK